jgi:hypothetical protein
MRDLLSKLDRILNESADLQDVKKHELADDPVIKKAIDDKEKLEPSKTEESWFSVGDEFGISFSEDMEIATEITDILDDGIVVDLDDAALEMLEDQGVLFLEGEITESEAIKGVDGKRCWKGYRRMGTKMKGGKRVDNCVKVGEGKFDFDDEDDESPEDPEKDKVQHIVMQARKAYDVEGNYPLTFKDGSKAKMPLSLLAKFLMAYNRSKPLEKEQLQNRAAQSPKDFQMAVMGEAVAEGDVDEAKYRGKEVPLGKKLPGDVKKSKVYVRKPNGNIVKVNFGDKKMRIKKSNPKRRKSFRARHNCKNPGPRWKARYWSCRSW